MSNGANPEAIAPDSGERVDKILNLTPHILNIECPGGEVQLPPHGPVPRVTYAESRARQLAHEGRFIPVVEITPTGIVDLPTEQPGVWLVVSRTLAEAADHRSDLLVPDDLIRDAEGSVIGARRLARHHRWPTPP